MKYFHFFLIFSIFLVFSTCKKEHLYKDYTLKGLVFGTTYKITYLNSDTNYQKSVDSLFLKMNLSLSTYMASSDISKINKGDTDVIVDDFFVEVFKKSKRIFIETDGFFDPTVGNLVNAWGFGPKIEKLNLTEDQVKVQMQFVGLDKVKLKKKHIVKEKPEIYLDFNSIAKGFGIDVVARFLSNKSMATSGNYRKFRITDTGKKYVHTINPKTGYATESNLLSVSVIADLDCADVDAYATAFMAMGLEKTKSFLDKNTKLEVILLFTNTEGNLEEYTNYTYK
jgi:thiamine biosynthesis lipoprotein